MKIFPATACLAILAAIAYFTAALLANPVVNEYDAIRNRCIDSGGHPVSVWSKDGDLLAIRCDLPMRGEP